MDKALRKAETNTSEAPRLRELLFATSSVFSLRIAKQK